LRFEGIDDDFVAALGPHPSLRGLSLADTNVTDRSIPAIIAMPALLAIDLPRDGVSKAGRDRLRKARPALKMQ
jgi:hypothetical protein